MFMKKIVIASLLLVLFTAGCIEEKVPEITTTTVAPTTTEITTTTVETTTTETPTTSTTTSRKCMFLNFEIISHAYRDGNFTFYFKNIGSELINDFEAHMYFTNKTSVESFTNQSIPYHVVRKYVLDVGPGLDNATFVETECGKKYFVNV